jgi:hypothetical protein
LIANECAAASKGEFWCRRFLLGRPVPLEGRGGVVVGVVVGVEAFEDRASGRDTGEGRSGS